MSVKSARARSGARERLSDAGRGREEMRVWMRGGRWM